MNNLKKIVSIDQALSSAKKLTKQGKISDAIALYNSILHHQPGHPIAKKRLHKIQRIA